MGTVEQLAEHFNRLKTIIDFANNSKFPQSPTGERSVDMEIYVKTLGGDPPAKASGLRAPMYSELGILMVEKITTSMSVCKGAPQGGDAWSKSVLESNEIPEVFPVVDAEQY